MAVASNIDLPESSARVHPHLLELLKSCASLVWSAASELLRRILELQPILSLPPLQDCGRCGGPPAPHISHVATSHCRILRSPPTSTVDVIFVHGLYGCLANTWKQGQWRKKKTALDKIPLRRHSFTDDNCRCNEKCYGSNSEPLGGERNHNQKNKYRDESQCIDCNCNKTTDRRTVESETNDERDQTKAETRGKVDYDYEDVEIEYVIDDEAQFNAHHNVEEKKKPESSIECECDKLYYEHSKNEKIQNQTNNNVNADTQTPEPGKQTPEPGKQTTELGKHKPEISNDCAEDVQNKSKRCEVGCGCLCPKCYSDCWPRDWLGVDYPDARVISVDYTSDPHLWRPIWIKEHKRLRLHERARQMTEQLIELGVGSRPIIWVGHSKGGLFAKQIYVEGYEEYRRGSCGPGAALWRQSAGFMFYSVPHRGSALADINIPPLVARSIELLEMGRDCADVLTLQSRWLQAVSGRAPSVRSLVETRRTLMAVLWLRIVSYESADAGVGALWGVSVDHREICKPSGRCCPLYRELLTLMDEALRGYANR